MSRRFLAVLVAMLVLLCGWVIPSVAATQTSKDFVYAKNGVAVWEGKKVTPELLAQGSFEGLEVTYKSDDQKVATVDSVTGEITGRSKGTCKVTASVKLKGKTYATSIKVTVRRQVTGLTVNENSWQVYAADDEEIVNLVEEGNELPVLVMVPDAELKVKATLTPASANNLEYTVTSDNTSVVKVTDTAVKAVGQGECVLTVASKSNRAVTKQYHVLVVNPVAKVTVSGASHTMYLGDDAMQLEAEVLPENATMPGLRWMSTDTAVATVSEDGEVTAIGTGIAYIKAFAVDGTEIHGTFKVTVDAHPTGVVISQDKQTVTDTWVNAGSQITLSASVRPGSVLDRSVTWKSSDKSIAKVSSKGVVTGVARGTCEITAASAADPSVQATVTVEVRQPITKITFEKSAVSVKVGGTRTLEPVIYPSDANNQNLSYKSSDKKIATVDAYGVVTGVKAGSCTITVTAKDGSGKKATIKINVIQPVTGVKMKSGSYRVGVGGTITVNAVISPSNASNKKITWSVDDPSIAKITGTGTSAKVYGRAWGTTTIHAVTSDGSFEATATLHVGNLNRAIKITDVYTVNNAIKLAACNVSNMTITHMTFRISLYDMYGEPLACNYYDGGNSFTATYSHTVTPGASTQHGRFSFNNFIQPDEQIGKVVVVLVSYRASDIGTHTIRSYQSPYSYAVYTAPGYTEPTPTPEPTSTPKPTEPVPTNEP